jgi:hypothetical protein
VRPALRLGALRPLPLLLPPLYDAPADLPWAQPGPSLGLASADFDVVRHESFRPDQRVAVTYFFYWFDAQSLKQQRAARGGAGVYPFTPVDADTMSFFDLDWYVKEFTDMQDAGLDAALPVYWGEPGQYDRRVAPAPDRNLLATQGLPPWWRPSTGSAREAGPSRWASSSTPPS